MFLVRLRHGTGVNIIVCNIHEKIINKKLYIDNTLGWGARHATTNYCQHAEGIK